MSIKKLILNIKTVPWLILFILTILIVWPIFLPGYFTHQDDLQVMRIFEMRKCFQDLQLPCRWIPDLGFGNGYPLFNYYNVFPYYIGAAASYILGFIGSAKLLFFISVALAGVSMYLFARNLLGTYPALVATTLYMFAPYRALDIYVRGAVAESFSIAIIPLVFHFAFRLAKEDLPKVRLGLALSFAAFLTSHNILVMLYLPVIVILLMVWFWQRDLKIIKSLIFCLLLGLGLSAFFIIPAFWEKNLVQIDNLVRFEGDFRAHFISLYQLFWDRSWGYGLSSGLGSRLSFQIGWPHYFLIIISFLSLFFIKEKSRRLLYLYIALLLSFVVAVFMTHNRSAFIWEQIGILRFTQFPWRFLSIAIFSASLIGGIFVSFVKPSWSKAVAIIVILATIVLNWNYFRPYQFIINLTDQEKLSGKSWQIQQRAAILDYLPVHAVEPLEPAPKMPMVVEGKAEIKNFENRSNRWKFEVTTVSQSRIEVPVFDFPGWQVFVNGKKITHSNKNYLGRISFTLSSGNYFIVGRFEDTLIRKISNIITVVSILVVIFISFNRRGLFFKEKWKN